MLILKILEVFWSFFGFWGYFDNFLGFGSILVIFWVLGILVNFRFQGYFGHFLDFRDILVITDCEADFTNIFCARRGAATKSLTTTVDVTKFAQTLAKTTNESQEEDQESSHFENQKPLVVIVN